MARRNPVRVPGWMKAAGAAEVVAAALEMERGASRRYARLAREAEDPVARAKLRYLAAEEAGHARVLSEMVRALPPPSKDFRLPRGLSEVRGAMTAGGIAPALELAIGAERRAQRLYRAAAALCAGKEGRATFERLARMEEHHEALLTDELRVARGEAAWSSLEGRVWAEEEFWSPS